MWLKPNDKTVDNITKIILLFGLGFGCCLVLLFFQISLIEGESFFVLSFFFFPVNCYVATCNSSGSSWRLIKKPIVSCIFSKVLRALQLNVQ